MSPSTSRGILYVTIAVLTYLQSALKEAMSFHDWIMLVIGTLLTGSVTLRAFIDQTPIGSPTEVKVVNPPADPVQTTDTKANAVT